VGVWQVAPRRRLRCEVVLGKCVRYYKTIVTVVMSRPCGRKSLSCMLSLPYNLGLVPCRLRWLVVGLEAGRLEAVDIRHLWRKEA